MVEINVEFHENYKKLDNLIRDMYNSKDGVTRYINEMEKVSYEHRRKFADWEYTYRQLKHMRWVRNQLSHNVGAFEKDICTKKDIDWIKDFYNQLMTCDDCLTNITKWIKATQQSDRSLSNKIVNQKGQQLENKLTLSCKIKLFFKKIFKKT